MKRSLVTGGAGFLGSHLCDRLLAEGHEVICLDNLITGDTENIAHLMKENKFSFVNYDVTNYLFVSGKIDYIFHFASPASPIDYLKLPIQTLKVGSLGTHKSKRCPLFYCFDIRSVWRSAHSSANRKLLG